MELISANTRTETWVKAVDHLLSREGEYDFNLILEVKEPLRSDRAVSQAEVVVDRFFHEFKLSPLHTVAETIFPAWEYRAHGADGVYRVYPEEVYPRMKRHKEFRWGTYAYRLLRGTTPKNFNPLQKCVQKLKDEADKRNPKRACFELGLSIPSIDLPLYDGDVDGAKRRGLPCLSHLSFKLAPGRQLLLTAMYRSHDYVQKALGNMLGLARLQAFVAAEAGLQVGPLVCHSTYAWLDTGVGRGINKIRELLSDIKGLRTPPTPQAS